MHEKNVYSVFILLAFFTQLSALSSLPYCSLHYSEIRGIRYEAQEAIILSHYQSGGMLFRSSFVLTPESAAFDLCRNMKNYSQFSDVFHNFMSHSQPKGLPALYSGFSKVSDLFFDMYSRCIAEHRNLNAYYERGRIYFDKGLYENCLVDIQPIIDSGQWEISEFDKNKEKEFLLVMGIAQLESNSYDQAINTLSD